jgi:hypothetical protein
VLSVDRFSYAHSTPSESTADSSGGLPILGIAIGGGAGAFVVAVITAVVIVRRKRSTRTQAVLKPPNRLAVVSVEAPIMHTPSPLLQTRSESLTKAGVFVGASDPIASPLFQKSGKGNRSSADKIQMKPVMTGKPKSGESAGSGLHFYQGSGAATRARTTKPMKRATAASTKLVPDFAVVNPLLVETKHWPLQGTSTGHAAV